MRRKRERDVGANASVAGSTPLPLNEAVSGFPSPVMLRLPARAPEAVGVKTIPIVHPVLGFRVVPQVFAEIRKSPLTVGAPKVVCAVPVFETVMFWTELVAFTLIAPKFANNGVRTIAPPGVALPFSATVACPPAILPKTVKVALRSPIAAGAKRT